MANDLPSTIFGLRSPSTSAFARGKRRLLSSSLDHTLDRVNVLGGDHDGHTGCVNALSWARGGDLLISGGDDRTIRLWRIDPSDDSNDYPFACEVVVETGHAANIFNAQMLPSSSRIATVAGDCEVRVCDVGATIPSARYSGETRFSTRQANVRVIRCHGNRVKRIITEESPDLFLTVSEDGTVRQHDLRVPHNCCSGACPAPLIKLNFDLSTIARSPLAPYQLVVAGESPYGYLFDRRHVGRSFQEEWGMSPDVDNVTTCVRRFGRTSLAEGERAGHEHITGAKMASSNGHEVLLSYSCDAVYLYSTQDDPLESKAKAKSFIIPPNRKSSRERSARSSSTGTARAQFETDIQMDEDIDRVMAEEALLTIGTASPLTGLNDDGHDEIMDDEDADEDEDEEEDEEDNEMHGGYQATDRISVVYPRARFEGACNVETVKDVNFLGPQDEFVTSGSDDGNVFIWKKANGQLHNILEGDGSVVNVIEDHPQLPLLAVSGIDTTVKLFAPARGPSAFSRMQNAESIMQRNRTASSRRVDLARLFLSYQLRMVEGTNIEDVPCTTQ
ncbi:WD40 repeat-like protein [Wolfiporia cocos MD-104 SS10]|uniref:WD40 repeat-like protein n=1 Tax=Wolfiporia cocos (strain MD-104) TaxID=742152 RepID=A0A2H3JQC8_WOLCO|nr:WD40 repeat-like protein [Wolfiporia cocos MD-104 SS10]